MFSGGGRGPAGMLLATERVDCQALTYVACVSVLEVYRRDNHGGHHSQPAAAHNLGQDPLAAVHCLSTAVATATSHKIVDSTHWTGNCMHRRSHRRYIDSRRSLDHSTHLVRILQELQVGRCTASEGAAAALGVADRP